MASDRPGRNDPCTCESGKKYKKCCLRAHEAEAAEARAAQQKAREEAGDEGGHVHGPGCSHG